MSPTLLTLQPELLLHIFSHAITTPSSFLTLLLVHPHLASLLRRYESTILRPHLRKWILDVPRTELPQHRYEPRPGEVVEKELLLAWNFLGDSPPQVPADGEEVQLAVPSLDAADLPQLKSIYRLARSICTVYQTNASLGIIIPYIYHLFWAILIEHSDSQTGQCDPGWYNRVKRVAQVTGVKDGGIRMLVKVVRDTVCRGLQREIEKSDFFHEFCERDKSGKLSLRALLE